MARHFNNANPDYITIGTGVRGTDLVGVMAACWVNLDDTTSQHGTMSRWNAGNANSQWNLGVLNGGQPYFVMLDAGLTGHQVNGAAITAGGWHHIAGMYDGATMHIFVDGVDTTLAQAGGMNDNVAATAVYLGRQTDAGAYLTGSLAECCILLVNTSVTPLVNYVAIIKAMSQGASIMAGMADTELLGYWPLLGGDSPEPDYGVGRDLAGPNAGVLTGTTSVPHPPTATLEAFGRGRGVHSASPIT